MHQVGLDHQSHLKAVPLDDDPHPGARLEAAQTAQAAARPGRNKIVQRDQDVIGHQSGSLGRTAREHFGHSQPARLRQSAAGHRAVKQAQAQADARVGRAPLEARQQRLVFRARHQEGVGVAQEREHLRGGSPHRGRSVAHRVDLDAGLLECGRGQCAWRGCLILLAGRGQPGLAHSPGGCHGQILVGYVVDVVLLEQLVATAQQVEDRGRLRAHRPIGLGLSPGLGLGSGTGSASGTGSVSASGTGTGTGSCATATVDHTTSAASAAAMVRPANRMSGTGQ